jgi:hypothetical protein
VRPPVEVVGTTAFVSARFAGVRILDIGDFTSVIFTDNFDTGDTTAWRRHHCVAVTSKEP